MIVMKYLHICGGNCNRSCKESRRSRRQLAMTESPVCRAGRNERKRHTEKSEDRQSH